MSRKLPPSLVPASPPKFDPNEFPSRETALAIIAALAKKEAATWSQLEQMTGIPNVMNVADYCFYVFGYPELEAGAIANAIAEVWMRPKKATAEPLLSEPASQPEPPAPDLSFGLGPRQ